MSHSGCSGQLSLLRSRGLRLLCLGMVALPLGLWAGRHVLLHLSAGSELHDALAETDRLDPGWRAEELEARRAAVPDAENAAYRVIAAAKLYDMTPGHERSFTRLLDELRELDPAVPMSARQQQDLEQFLQKTRAALVEARKLAAYPQGRFPAGVKRSWQPSPRPIVEDIATVAWLLFLDACARAERNDFPAAVSSCIALLNTGRSIGDEPDLPSQLRRHACRVRTVLALERILAQSQAAEPALATLQAALQDEEAQPLLLTAARAERARLLLGAFQVPACPPATAARLLRYHTRLVEIAKLRPEEQCPRLQELHAAWNAEPTPLGKFSCATEADKFLLGHAKLRCALVMVAAERYRRLHGHLPRTLAALVPAQLQAVPLDPFDGQALRWRRLDRGALVYSIGPDGKDNGGTLDWKYWGILPGTDVGCRLWDVPQHRRTARDQQPGIGKARLPLAAGPLPFP